MDKNSFAKTPPMGWNSWDCYGASVTEEEIRGNALYMAQNMKEFGWQYVVCDIQWYEPEAKSAVYNNFYPLAMDGYSRLIPAVNRFPSSANGAGFAPLAEYVHSLGLKFGIHIMRGVPRQAVHNMTPILGSASAARDIAQQYSVCPWNTDMYGVNPEAEGAQRYYDSLFELYAQWGVDFVKADDICVVEHTQTHPYSAKREIEMLRSAIDRCGREIVLSLSPGPAPLNEAEHLCRNANMWRITGDFWDNWPQLYAMFERCDSWSRYTRSGCWPDCDMLPLGRIAVNKPGHDQNARYTNFSPEEQKTMVTLWCIFRSPLMVGAQLRDNDAFTLSLLTNREILQMHRESCGARQVYRHADTVIWCGDDGSGGKYAAFFNTSFSDSSPDIPLTLFGISGKVRVRDLWNSRDMGRAEKRFTAKLPPHGAAAFRFSPL